MTGSIDEIILIREDYEAPDTYAKIDAVMTFVEGLHGGLYEFSELPKEAVQIFWTDYYLGQIANGGPAQFVFNSKWDTEKVEAVANGLKAIGSKTHAKLFDGLRSRVDELGLEGLERLLASTYFGENPERDFLNDNDQPFFDALKEEDTTALMTAYIEGLDNVVLLSPDEWKTRMEALFDSVPDLQARKKAAEENVHWHVKIAEKLSDFVGEKFDRITGMEFIEIAEGRPRPFVFFLTNKGLRAMLLANGIATMVDEDAGGTPMAEYPCPEAVHPGDEDGSHIQPRKFGGGGLFGGIKKLFGG